MQTDTLVVVLGDSPRMPTGLGRIAGDLAAHLYFCRERLGIDLVQFGWEYGMPRLTAFPWPLVTFPEIGEDWAASRIVPAIEQLRQDKGYEPNQVVLLTAWDPARCFEYRELPYEKWGYFAVDGHNKNGTFGGPAAEAVRRYTRVLGYTQYGAEMLGKVCNPLTAPNGTQWLPHGHYIGQQERQWATENAVPPPGWRLGCVASNTPRKDLGLFFAVLRELRDGGERVHGWLHTDELVTGAWSIPELMDVHKIDQHWVSVSTPPATDQGLHALYASCAVTLAVGRGEGFCYPIVESLALGRPVVHVDYAGGAELTPPEGRVVPEAFDYTNPYAVGRPLLNVADVAARCSELAKRMLEDDTLPAYYAGTVANLHWRELWPRWETWVRQGLKELRERR